MPDSSVLGVARAGTLRQRDAYYRPRRMSQPSQPTAPASPTGADHPHPEADKVSEQLERWLRTDGDKTLGSLVDVFDDKSFAILFVLLLGVPALPLPTGGVTHVFETIAVLLALELIAGRDQIWVPQRSVALKPPHLCFARERERLGRQAARSCLGRLPSAPSDDRRTLAHDARSSRDQVVSVGSSLSSDPGA